MTTLEARPTAALAKSWQVTTATRVFVVALAFGQALSAGSLKTVGVLLLALTILAAVTCAIEYETTSGVGRWAPYAEGILAAALVGTADAAAAPLLVYLAVPSVVAGLRWGWVAASNASLATSFTLAAAWAAAETLGLAAPQIPASVPWIIVGSGVGLLASWQTRSVRAIQDSQAPYAAAHRLLSQLRNVSRQLTGGLDSRGVAERLVGDLQKATGAARAALVIRSGDRTISTVEAGLSPSSRADVAEIALDSMGINRRTSRRGLVALPLRVGTYAFGAAVVELGSDEPPSPSVQRLLDEWSLQLDSALLFDEIRSVATSEERHRLAREIHDGVAQEVASLGYLVDELTATSADPAVTDMAATLRSEITRVVSELRLSIFDLRHSINEPGDLAGALSEYVNEVGARSDVRVHLRLDQQPTPMSPAVKEQLLRIAQEAITNARQHSRAENLWVRLTTDGHGAHLQVEDDGGGTPTPRPQHFGLQTMRERAALINAEFDIKSRPGGGTIVVVGTHPHPGDLGVPFVDRRAARR